MSLFENDRALLAAFRAGDRVALERVYRHFVDDVLAVVRRGFAVEWKGHLYVRGTDAELARDLVQEVFVRAFQPAARTAYDGLRPYRPYLLTIARNLLADTLRRRRPEVELTEDHELATDVPPDLDDEFDAELVLTREYLAALDEPLAHFVRLRFTEGRSQVDVAAELGTTRRHVRTLEKKVSRGLRKHLKSRGRRPSTIFSRPDRA